MKTVALLLLSALLAHSAAATQGNPTQKQLDLAREMLKLAGAADAPKQMLDTIVLQAQESMLASATTDEARQEATARVKRLRELLQTQLDLSDFVDEMVVVYARTFTEAELVQIVEFYKLPAGQKLVARQGELITESARMGREKIGPKLAVIYKQLAHEEELQHPWVRTMADVRSIATCIEAWAIDHDDEYPASVSLESLRSELEPTYVRTLPLKDVWGNGYAYVSSPDHQSYRIVSAGSDGVFEWDSREVRKSTGEAQLHISDNLKDDIIYADGQFVQLPRASQPKNEAGQ